MKVLVTAAILCVAGAGVVRTEDGTLSDAEAFFQAKDYARAAEGYRAILEGTDDPETRTRCLLRIGDCCYWVGPFGEDSPDIFYARVFKQGYSSDLAEAYIKWRATTQMYRHGVSNFSEIPVGKYHARRRHVLRIIGAHLKAHPGDQTALAQQEFLLKLPDIQRGGPMGSSVLNEMGMLWPLEEEVSE